MGEQKIEEASVAVLPVPAEKREPRRSPPKSKEAPKFHVILWDDDDHTADYVVEMVIKIFNHSLAQAEDIAWRVHHEGKAIAITCHQELAELKREQIKNYGPEAGLKDARQVSMKATIEEAP